MNSQESITISTNYWRVPSVESAFSGILEGNPTEEQRQQIRDAAITARASWKPNSEALALVEQMKMFIGSRVQIQFWDSCMWLLEEEGPYPCAADCIDVVVRNDGAFPQAYLLVKNLKDIPNSDGYSPSPYFLNQVDSDLLLAPLADIYLISKISEGLAL